MKFHTLDENLQKEAGIAMKPEERLNNVPLSWKGWGVLAHLYDQQLNYV